MAPDFAAAGPDPQGFPRKLTCWYTYILGLLRSLFERGGLFC